MGLTGMGPLSNGTDKHGLGYIKHTHELGYIKHIHELGYIKHTHGLG